MRSSWSGWLALLSGVLLGGPGKAFGQDFAWPVVPCATGRFEIAMDRACRGVALQPHEIRFREDYLPVDPFRLSCFNRWFRDPLGWPGEMDRSSSRLLQGPWRARLEQLAAWGDFDLPGLPGNSIEARLRGSVASSWKDRRLPPRLSRRDSKNGASPSPRSPAMAVPLDSAPGGHPCFERQRGWIARYETAREFAFPDDATLSRRCGREGTGRG